MRALIPYTNYDPTHAVWQSRMGGGHHRFGYRGALDRWAESVGLVEPTPRTLRVRNYHLTIDPDLCYS